MKSQWNLLSPIPQNFDPSKYVSKQAEQVLADLIIGYPQPTKSMISFIGDIYLGNLFGTFIIDILEQNEKLEYGCLRIDAFNPDLDRIFSAYYLDVLILDNLQFDIFNKENFNFFFQLFKVGFEKSRIIIFNLPSKRVIEHCPETIISYIKQSTNIQIHNKG